MWETWLSSLGREDPLEKGKRRINMVWYHLFVELKKKKKKEPISQKESKIVAS